MKSTLFAAHARIRIIACVLATLCLTSCSGPNKTHEPMDSAHAKWEEQLQHALLLSTVNNKKITFRGYEYLGKVKSKTEKALLIDEMFADSTYTVVYNGMEFSEPEFRTWGDMRKKIKDFGLRLRANIESDIVIGETDVIDLEWRFKNKTYHSKAIASDARGGIIYDNIGTYAIDYRVSYEERGVYETGAESDGNYRITIKKYEYGTDMSGSAQ